MKIGYLKYAYPEQRCIINKLGGVEAKYICCWEKLAKTRIKGKIRRILTGKELGWNALYYDPIFMPSVDIVHTFNHVCEIEEPWVVTFESTVPRTNQTVERIWEADESIVLRPDRITQKSLDALMKPNCIGLIALSDSAKKIQVEMLKHVNHIDAEALESKLMVIHPPQDVLVDEEWVHQKYMNMDRRMEFLFIGHDFFRKGGVQMVETLRRYVDRHGIHLTVVGRLSFEKWGTKKEREEWEGILNNEAWITWYETLPNDEVLKLCKKAHVGCLPTFQDTYGYSILEMQACGCPVITTDIRAIPEINDSSCGWLISLEKNAVGGEAIHYTKEDKKKRKEELLGGLTQCLENIFLHPEQIEQKALNSLNRIKAFHNPQEYATKIREVYGRAQRQVS